MTGHLTHVNGAVSCNIFTGFWSQSLKSMSIVTPPLVSSSRMCVEMVLSNGRPRREPGTSKVELMCSPRVVDDRSSTTLLQNRVYLVDAQAVSDTTERPVSISVLAWHLRVWKAVFEYSAHASRIVCSQSWPRSRSAEDGDVSKRKWILSVKAEFTGYGWSS